MTISLTALLAIEAELDATRQRLGAIAELIADAVVEAEAEAAAPTATAPTEPSGSSWLSNLLDPKPDER